MRSLIEFSLDATDSILIEVEEASNVLNDDEGLAAISGNKIIVKAQQSFSEALEKIKPTASAIINKIRELHEPPDEVEVKFGIKMTAEAGAIVAAATVEGNYEITLKWKNTERSKNGHSLDHGDSTNPIS